MAMTSRACVGGGGFSTAAPDSGELDPRDDVAVDDGDSSSMEGDGDTASSGNSSSGKKAAT